MTKAQKVSIKTWAKNAAEDLKTAKFLLKGKYFGMSLFSCHLAIEKMLKALVEIETNEPAPFTHDLTKLAKLAGINLTLSQAASLNEITTFNISGRYREEKYQFNTMVNRDYALKYIEITEQLYKWLRRRYLKKLIKKS